MSDEVKVVSIKPSQPKLTALSEEQKKARISMLVENASLMRRELLSTLLDPRRDLNAECGYPEFITAENYRRIYDREGLGTRVIQVVPEESWARDPEVYDSEEPELKSMFEKAFSKLEKKLNIFHYLARADEVSGIGRFGIILLGIDDGKPLDQPIEGVEAAELKAALTPMEFEPADEPPEEEQEDDEEGLIPPEEDDQEEEPEVEDPEEETDPEETEEPEEEQESEITLPPGEEEDEEEPEVKPIAARRNLLFLRVFDESVVTVDQRETSLQSPRYGKPTLYTIRFRDHDGPSRGSSGPSLIQDPQAPAQTVTETSLKVHWTRVIHLADNRQLSEVYGVPRLQAVFNRIYDSMKVCGGSGEMFWKGGFPGYSFEVSPGVTDPIMDADALREELANYANGLQRYLAITGVTAKSLAPQVADPTAHMAMIIDYICIALAIPKRIFVGSERGELASSQDLRAWNTRLRRRQEKYLSPMVIRPFVDRLIHIGILPVPGGGSEEVEVAEEDGLRKKPKAKSKKPKAKMRPMGEYEIYWPDLNTVTDDEKAEVAVKLTQALAQFVSGGVEAIFPPAEFFGMILGMEPEEIEKVIKAAEEFQVDLDEKAFKDAEKAKELSDKAGQPVGPDGKPLPPPPFGGKGPPPADESPADEPPAE